MTFTLNYLIGGQQYANFELETARTITDTMKAMKKDLLFGSSANWIFGVDFTVNKYRHIQTC